MLATASSGERSRTWLQDRLWGRRDRTQAQASLRRELVNLRRTVETSFGCLVVADHEAVRLELALMHVDVRLRDEVCRSRGEFLEGADLAGEDGFEDWLRGERQAVLDQREAAPLVEITSLAMSAPPIAATLAGRPKLAVLVEPQDLPGSLAAIVEGVAYDLAERIARLRWLLIVGSPAGTLRRQGDTGLERAGALLGVDYLLHCRMGANRIFHVALSEHDGRVLWSGRFPFSEPVTADEVEGVAISAIAALALRIEVDQQQRAREREIHQLNADELVWRARWHMRRLTREDAQTAERLLDMAIAAQPNSAEALLEKGYADAWRLWSSGAGTEAIEQLRRRMEDARDLDPCDARGWLLLGILDMWLSRHDSAISLMREALGINPSLSFGYGHLGSCHSLSSRPADALPLVRMALRLNPVDVHNFHQFGELALANLMLGDFAAAVAEADAALARRTGYAYGHALKTAALWIGGDLKGARDAAVMLRRARPGYDPAALEWLPFRDRSWNRRLRKAVSAALDEPGDGRRRTN